MQMDERRIQEIVERVLSRLGPDAVPRTPMEAALKAADAQAGRPAPAFVPPHLRDKADAEGNKARIPKGSLGVFSDIDAAVTAARTAYETYQKTPLQVRERMVAAMR